MARQRRWMSLVVCLVLLVAIPVSATPPDPYAYPQGTVRVGVLMPQAMLPGIVEEALNAIDMARNQATQAGANIELVIVDSGCDGTAASDTINTLIGLGVHYVLGPVCNRASWAAAPIAEANGVVMLTPISDYGDISRVGDTNREYVFAFPAKMETMSRAAAAEMRHRGLQTPVVIYDAGGDDSEMRADVFDAAWQALGGDPLLKLAWDPRSSATLKMDEAKAAGADCLAYVVSGEFVGDLATAANDSGMGALPVFAGRTWENGEIDCSELGEAYTVTDGSTDGARAAEAAFYAQFRASYDGEPGRWALLCYDAATVLFDAIATAGVDDPMLVRQALADSLYDGVLGTGGFDMYGDAARDIHVVQWGSDCGRTYVRSWAPVSGLEMSAPPGFWSAGRAGDLSATIWHGSSVDYAWCFGDGSHGSGEQVAHTFAAAGTYTVTATAECPLCIEAPTASQAIEVYDLQPQAYVPFVER